MSSRNELWRSTQVSYAIACLDYTSQTNKTLEQRITILIGLDSGALGANNYLLRDGEGVWLSILVLLSASLVFLSFIFVLAGLVSKTYNRDSIMLPEWIAKRPRAEYVIACRERAEQQMLDALAIENHAFAQAAVYRTRCHHWGSRFFVAGAAVLLLACITFFLQQVQA